MKILAAIILCEIAILLQHVAGALLDVAEAINQIGKILINKARKYHESIIR